MSRKAKMFTAPSDFWTAVFNACLAEQKQGASRTKAMTLRFFTEVEPSPAYSLAADTAEWKDRLTAHNIEQSRLAKLAEAGDSEAQELHDLNGEAFSTTRSIRSRILAVVKSVKDDVAPIRDAYRKGEYPVSLNHAARLANGPRKNKGPAESRSDKGETSEGGETPEGGEGGETPAPKVQKMTAEETLAEVIRLLSDSSDDVVDKVYFWCEQHKAARPEVQSA